MKSIIWKAPEYEHRQKSKDWYWSVGIVGVSVAVASAILGNILFGLLIIIAFFALLLHSVKKPRVIEMEASEKGVRIESRLFPYQYLEGFWIEESLMGRKLLIKSKKLLSPLIVLPISSETSLDNLKNLLEEHMTSEYLQESFLEQLMERFGF